MVPKRMDSTNQEWLPATARAHCDVVQAGLPWQGMANLYKLAGYPCYAREEPRLSTG